MQLGPVTFGRHSLTLVLYASGCAKPVRPNSECYTFAASLTGSTMSDAVRADLAPLCDHGEWSADAHGINFTDGLRRSEGGREQDRAAQVEKAHTWT